MQTENPKIKIPSQGLAENRYGCGKNRWAAATLVQWVKEKDYKPFKFPLAAFNLSQEWDGIDTTKSLVHHCKRIMNADLSYPIIFDSDGCIADGYHRCMRALIEGKTEVDAVRIEEMPLPDGYDED